MYLFKLFHYTKKCYYWDFLSWQYQQLVRVIRTAAFYGHMTFSFVSGTQNMPVDVTKYIACMVHSSLAFKGG